ncbi:NAD-dependent epimerase/dehydratase family protein [Nesterenkonia sp. AY15]|uniref:NAD-dependent epimerase/dehydratase family protein n=1 Tax=Nesterenkonia sp. AY15 TaxID=2901139 RepID=UPI001F4D021B|nr:NAD-dependent epimerase/dehydratase family protein [Nesterenkonia sp. AY15]MCH8569985.1 NAD-dependent epimerase/dehydratase family protein [Nesterenkonia sp. AY15]
MTASAAPLPADSPTPRAVLVGCGDVGTRIGHRLLDQGWNVSGWRRSPERLPASFDGTAVDLTEESTVPAPPADTTAVVFSPAAGSRDPQRYEQVYLRGLETVLDRITQANLAETVQVLLVSSTSVLGDASGRLDESAPLTPAGPTGEVLARTEQLLQKWRDAGAESSARSRSGILRLSGIYGPGRDRLIKQLRSGSVGEAAGQDAHEAWRISNRIHSDDAARAAVELLTSAAPPELVLGVDKLPVPLGVVHNWMADQLELPRPWSDPRLDPQVLDSVPLNSPVRHHADSPSGSVLTDSSPSGEDLFDSALLGAGHGKALDGSLLHRLLGELLHPDFRSGYTAALRE